MGTPNRYLSKVVKLLTGARGLGHADRVREGYLPYSNELDFRDVDESTARAKIAWAADQAPYAQIELTPSSGAMGLLTVFAWVDLVKLAMYLCEHVLMQETGQTWETATGQVPATLRRIIHETVGSGKDWQELLDGCDVASGWLVAAASIVAGDGDLMPGLDVAHDAITRIVPAAAYEALLADLKQQIALLAAVRLAIESGEYLKQT